MRSTSLTHGVARHHDQPDWTPLEKLLGSDTLCAHFMWMFDIELDDGTIVNAYKHRWTRSYIHLANDQRTFFYVGNEAYRSVDRGSAVQAAFDGWECCRPTAAERMALQAALVNARRTGSGEEAADAHG